MDNLKEKVAMVIDYGMFISLAVKLSESFGKVKYYSPWHSSFPMYEDWAIGQGIPEIERVDHYLDDIDSVDIFIFTDIYNKSIANDLRNRGKLVWSMFDAEDYETDRKLFRQLVESMGYPVPKTEYISGIDNLREYLQDKENVWVKPSVWRGNKETFKWKSKSLSEPILDDLQLSNGLKYKGQIEFIVEENFDAAETGIDTFTVNGEFPDKVCWGIEIKDTGFIGKIVDYDSIPQQLKDAQRVVSVIAEGAESCGKVSTEVRIDKLGKGFFTDFTPREPSPPGTCLIEAFSNWAEIMWYGSQGILVQPIPEFKFVGEIFIYSQWALTRTTEISYPEQISRWVKPRNYQIIDGKTFTIPRREQNIICSVVGNGNTLEEVIRNLQERVSQVECIESEYKMEFVQEFIDNVKKLKNNGIIWPAK